MEELKKNKIFWIFAIVTGLFLGSIVMEKVIVSRVITRLQKDYSPSPYGPGMDPDKISSKSAQLHNSETIVPSINVQQNWETSWEKSRNSNPKP